MKNKHRILLTILTLGLQASCYGASGSWTVAGDGTWNVDGNWSGLTYPQLATESATIDTSDPVTQINLTSSATIGTLNFGSNLNTNVSVTADGGVTLFLDNGGSAATITNAAALPSQFISAPLSLTSNLSVQATGFKTEITGNISGAGGITAELGSGGEILTLSGTNTYAGATAVTSGSLYLNSTAAIPAGTTLTNSSIVQFDSVEGTMNDFDITNNGSLIIVPQSSTVTYVGDISGTGSLTVQVGGGGTPVLSGTNTYTGTTTINIGGASLQLDSTTALPAASIITNSGTLTIGDVNGTMNTLDLSGNNDSLVFATTSSGTTTVYPGVIPSGTVTKQGAGRVNLSGNNSYVIPTTLTAGTIGLSHNSALGTSSLNMASGTTLALDSGISASNNVAITTSGTVDVTTGNGTLSGVISGGALTKTGAGGLLLSGVNTYTGTTTISAGTLFLSSGGTIDDSANVVVDGTLDTAASTGGNRTFKNLSGAGSGTLTTTSKSITIDSSSDTTFAGTVTGTSMTLIKIGTSTFTLSGTSNAFQTTTVTAGTLQLDATGAIASTNTVTNNATLTVGDINGTMNTFAVINAGTMTFATTTGGNTTTYGGTISSTGAVTKTGVGTAVLSGTNSYSGGTTVSAGTLRVSADENLGSGAGALTFTGGTGTLNVSSSYTSTRGIVMTAAGTIDVDTSQTYTSLGVVSGSGNLTKAGAGILELAATNTYTGNTIITAGTVEVDANADLGNTSSSVVFNGGTLNTRGIFSTARTITMTGTGTINVDSSTTLTHTGDISGSGALTKSGDGDLTLSTSNTYSGSVALTAGSITLGNDTSLGTSSLAMSTGTTLTLDGVSASNTITIAGTSTISPVSGTSTLSGIISSSGTLAKTGSNTLILSGANTYSGGTTLSEGTITLSHNTGLGSGTLAMATGTTLGLSSGVSASNAVTIAGTSTVNVASGTGTLSGVISSTGTLAKTGANTLVLSGANTYSGGTTLSAGRITLSHNTGLGSGTLAMSTTTTLALSSGVSASNAVTIAGVSSVNVASGTATLSGVISSTGALTKTGSGTLVLSGTNTYAGATTIAGTAQVSADANLGDTGTPAAVIFNVGTLNTTATFSSARAITMIGSGELQVDTGTTLTFSGVVSGAWPLTKSGAGTLLLSGTNTYTGTTTISAGTLRVSADNNLGDTGTPAAVIFNGGTLNTTATFSSARAVTMTSTGTIDVDTATTLTLSGVISSTGSLTKSGAGILALGGTNTYTGTTTISTGTLRAGVVSALPSATAVTLADTAGVTLNLNDFAQTIGSLAGGGSTGGNVTLGSATLTVGGATSTSYGGVISGTGALIRSGSGTQTLTGTNTYSGGTTISGGGLTGNAATFGTGAITNNATLTLNQATTATFSLPVSGATGAFIKSGSGALTINSDISQLTATISAGTLLVASTKTLTASTVTVSSGGTLRGNGTVVGTVSVSGTVQPGASIGTLNITGNYTQVTGSTLEIELNPTQADLLAITENMFIQTGATLALIPDPGTYSSPYAPTIVTAASITGTFDTITNTLPSFAADAHYLPVGSPTRIQLLFSIIPFADFITSGNAAQVANAFDSASVVQGSDLDLVIDSLRFLTQDQITTSMNQMQPSILNSLDLCEEETIVQLRSVINHSQNSYHRFPCQETNECKNRRRFFSFQSKENSKLPGCETKKFNVWGDFFYLQSKQNPIEGQVGFTTHTKAVVAGIDYQWLPYLYSGGALGVTVDRLNWNDEAGLSRINSYYTSLYAGLESQYGYARFVAIGGNNRYNTTRKIYVPGDEYPAIIRSAHNTGTGWSALGNVELGLILKKGPMFKFCPFGKMDYIWIHRNATSEEGALSLDLHLNDHSADLLRFEGGLEFFRPICFPSFTCTPHGKISYGYELRVQGKNSEAYFLAIPATPMTVKGMSPDRGFLSYGLGVDASSKVKHLSLSVDYEGDLASHYWNQSLSVQVKRAF